MIAEDPPDTRADPWNLPEPEAKLLSVYTLSSSSSLSKNHPPTRIHRLVVHKSWSKLVHQVWATGQFRGHNRRDILDIRPESHGIFPTHRCASITSSSRPFRSVTSVFIRASSSSMERSLAVCTQPEPQGLDPQGLFDRIDK